MVIYPYLRDERRIFPQSIKLGIAFIYYRKGEMIFYDQPFFGIKNVSKGINLSICETTLSRKRIKAGSYGTKKLNFK